MQKASNAMSFRESFPIVDAVIGVSSPSLETEYVCIERGMEIHKIGTARG